MKKILCGMLIAALLCLSVGCRQAEQIAASPTDTYKTLVQNYIASGDYDAAIKVLETAIATTDDASFQQMLDGVLALKEAMSGEGTQTTEAVTEETPDYSAYSGKWADGALVLTLNGESFQLYAETGSSFRSASMETTFLLSEIINGVVEFSYTDSWENRGTCRLTFAEDHIIMTISDVIESPDATYGFYEGEEIYYKDSEQEETIPIETAPAAHSIEGDYICLDRSEWLMVIYLEESTGRLIAAVPLPYTMAVVILEKIDDTHYHGIYEDYGKPAIDVKLEFKKNNKVTVSYLDHDVNDTFYYDYILAD